MIYTMTQNDEELHIMNELDIDIIVTEKKQHGYLYISTLLEHADSIDEIILDKNQAQFLKAVLDQIL